MQNNAITMSNLPFTKSINNFLTEAEEVTEHFFVHTIKDSAIYIALIFIVVTLYIIFLRKITGNETSLKKSCRYCNNKTSSNLPSLNASLYLGIGIGACIGACIGIIIIFSLAISR